MVKIKTIIILISALFLYGFAYFLIKDDLPINGRIYSSKLLLCKDFALSYLRTIPKVERDYTGSTRKMAIDVETELYNLCLIDLNPESLSRFRTKTLDKYSQETSGILFK